MIAQYDEKLDVLRDLVQAGHRLFETLDGVRRSLWMGVIVLQTVA